MSVLSKVTYKNLIKNKTRTIVTLVGVILSAAMIMAVATFIVSFQHFFVMSESKSSGSWHTVVRNLPLSTAKKVLQNNEVKAGGMLQVQGYAKLPGGQNESKPYLYVTSWSKECYDMLPVRLVDGRLPLDETELIIPDHVSSNGGVVYSLGEKITLNVGTRALSDGTIGDQNTPFSPPESGTTEILKNTTTKTYTVVGFFERPDYEGYNAPGYTAISGLSAASLTDESRVSLYYTVKNPLDSYSFAKKQFGKAYPYEMHTDLLRYQGAGDSDEVNKVLYGMGGVLIALIMLGSISLIYNSFSISVSERSKQFGMLSGAGATSKQIRRMVFTEAIYISLIGIPLGILAGIGGMGVTFYALKDMFSTASKFGLYPTLTVSLYAIIVSVLVGLVTILISAYIPARRAAKMSAIEAIRSSKDVRIKAKQMKTSRIIRRIFGMEGDLAVKNFKRNRRRYRSTVVSLFISIVLFVASSAFTMYMSDSAGTVFNDANYDILYSSEQGTKDAALTEFFHSAKDVEGVTDIAMVWSNIALSTTLNDTELSEATKKNATNYDKTAGKLEATLYLTVLDDESFRAYCKECGLDSSLYLDRNNPRAIAFDKQLIMTGKKYADYSLFKEKSPISLPLNAYNSDTEKIEPTNSSLAVAAFADHAPMGSPSVYYSPGAVALYLSKTASESASLKEALPSVENPSIAFRAKDPTAVYNKLEAMLKEMHLSYSYLNNVYSSVESTRNTITIVNVFSYGFIILISLIATANVFNTISTNVNLRRREFAMLKSIGMTKRGFNKMMNFECIFYGLKAILYGLPVSIVFTYLMYKSISSGVEVGFYLPWGSILVAVLSVFAVVFATMLYSMSKIRNENIVDALKNENL